MDVLNQTIPTVKTETADVQALLRAHINDNGHARSGGNGRRRRIRHQIHNGRRRAALKADAAIRLVEIGMSVTDAIERCNTNPAYYYAMKTLRESGNTAFYDRALEGPASVLASAKRMKNAAAAITAIQKCSVMECELVRLATGMTSDPVTMLLNLSADQLVATGNALGLDWIFDHMIAAAIPTKPMMGK